MRSTLPFFGTLGLLIQASLGQKVNFPFESIQLRESDVGNFTAISFGSLTSPGQQLSVKNATECKVFPGSDDWPTEEEWKRLNSTLDGALLKPVPAGSACYPGPSYDADRCRFLVRTAGASHFWLDDPLTSLTQWTQGNTCLVSANAQGNCSQGGFPVYVVNATTVKHIQAAINFARNKNIRLVIKNTGHDFGGRSVGAGSLSIWVHNIKEFELVPNYSLGQYTGPAVRVGAGVESWEMFNHMSENNITVIAPGGQTVGMVGAFLGAGGHSTLTSTWGLASDQALAIQVVTADGKFLTTDPNTNKDLFWALRGGGGGTFGVITSVIYKAYPPIDVTATSVNLAVGKTGGGSTPNYTNGTNNGTQDFHQPLPPSYVRDVETFWKAVGLYHRFGQKIVDAGGIIFGYIYPQGNNSYIFTSSQEMPGLTPEQLRDLMQPFYDDLLKIGVNQTNPLPKISNRYGGGKRGGGGDSPGQQRYRSRLFPRKNWNDDKLWDTTMTAIRKTVEAAGIEYTFHSVMHQPSMQVAGWPGNDSSINPAWRTSIMHASMMQKQIANLTAAQAKQKDVEGNRYMDMFKEVTPGSGAYVNEADPAEPNWQESFFGSLYPRLLQIKKQYDPFGLFWAPTTVGSEGWDVRAEDGYPFSQNGRLCRVKA